MQVIGITGGVGSGKSAILEYLEENYRVKNLEADRIAQRLMEPGTECHKKLLRILPAGLVEEDGSIDRAALAEELFRSDELRDQVNGVVHPAVKEEILGQIDEQKEIGVLDFVVIEAALLIEGNYDRICDEFWYIYAPEEIRRRRLMEKRGYSKEKVELIFASQLSDAEYRRHCQTVIDNSGTKEETFYQVAQIMKEKGEMRQMEQELSEVPLVFGLDIGTRNVVGTVGYKEENEFYVIAQYMKEHETRSMLDGQIHDIGRVGRTIHAVKKALEEQLHIRLDEVCIAAAGRVLKTVSTTVEYMFPEEMVVTGEDVHTLDLLGVEKAQQILNENNDSHLKFYCVGYSVVKYYLNGDMFSNLEGHKAEVISEEIIVTFLPEDVVDGLYSAVGLAGLRVANLTLEPIAAINVAIPETFRMLNIALVDVGAGTSDISITRDGSIIAYGMIPCAGDEITELLVQHYLVDFKTAEYIKLSSTTEKEIEYQDIMMIRHTVDAEEIWDLIKPLVDSLTEDIADKIKELNGGASVSATFVVGGGGKVHGFVENLAAELGLPQERVALRGEEVLQEIHFEQPEIKKDPLLVTPIGICLNYYDQRNNFIFVRFNGERMKLYDNSKLTIVDAAMQAGFPNEQLFPRRGREINFTVNGKKRVVRGETGESAIVRVNDRISSINAPLEPNSEIVIEPSTVGAPASCRLEELEEYGKSSLTFEVNGKLVSCPKFVEVNGSLEPPDYEIQEGDRVETRNFYTVSQLIEFMDVEIDTDMDILVNNKPADFGTLVYENFSVEWREITYRTHQSEIDKRQAALREEMREVPEEPSQAGQESPFGIREQAALRTGLVQEGMAGNPTEQRNKAIGNPTEQRGELPGNPTGQRDETVGNQFAQRDELPGNPTGQRNKAVGNPAEQRGELPGSLSARMEEAEPGERIWPERELPGNPTARWDETVENQSAQREGTAGNPTGQRDETVGNQSGQRDELPGNPTEQRNKAVGNQSEQRGELPGSLSARMEEAEPGERIWPEQERMESPGSEGFSRSGLDQGRGDDLEGAGQPGRETAGSLTPGRETSGSQAPGRETAGSLISERETSGSQASGGTHGTAQAERLGFAQEEESRELTQEELEEKFMQSQQAAENDIRPTVVKRQPEAGTAFYGEGTVPLQVIVNNKSVTLTGKASYIFVDVFNAIDFDLKAGGGRAIVTKLNGETPSYTTPLKYGDRVEIYWEGQR